MPNRIIREGILSSEKVCALGWAEEVFYRRLMSVVDDYGRFEANHQLLRSRCYPLQTDAVRVADISRWLAACETAGLIVLYEGQGKQLLEVSGFKQQTRTPSKYPDPPKLPCEQMISIDSKGYQMPSLAHLGVSVVEGVVGDGKPPSPDVGLTEFDCMQVVMTWNESARIRSGPGGLAQHVSATLSKGDKEHLHALWSKDFKDAFCRALKVVEKGGTNKQKAVTLGDFLSFSNVRDSLMGLATQPLSADDFEARKERIKRRQQQGATQ